MQRWIWATAFLFSLVPIAAEGQFAVELRGGGAIGNHGAAASGMETIPGPSVSATLLASGTEWLSVYGSFVRAGFGCEEGFCRDRSVDFVSTGYGGGIRLHPFGAPWLQAGLLRLATSVTTSKDTESGDPAVSAEVATGLRIPLMGSVRLVPAVVYRGSLDSELRTTVLTAELGVQLSLP